MRTAPSPDPPDSSWWHLRRLQTPVLAYTSPSRSPIPRHLAVLARPGFVGAATTLTGTSRSRLPPASPSCCDRMMAAVSHPTRSIQRLTAHVPQVPAVADPHSLRQRAADRLGLGARAVSAHHFHAGMGTQPPLQRVGARDRAGHQPACGSRRRRAPGHTAAGDGARSRPHPTPSQPATAAPAHAAASGSRYAVTTAPPVPIPPGRWPARPTR